MEKFRIGIIDFMPEHGKHEVGADMNGDKLCLGDMVRYNNQDWFVGHRYGDTVLKQVGMMAMIVPKDFSRTEKINVFGAGTDWLIIGYANSIPL